MKIIRIAAALLIGADGRTLLVRKRGTQAFMQPGGKIEPGEPAPQALARELEEELGLIVDPAQAVFLGEFTAPAANEPGFEVNCQLYEVRTDAQALPAAEIEEVLWVDADSHAGLQLAPLTRDLILPLYLKRQAARS
ncbi:NUDIX domain-containing protein [Pseudomonas syringae pv. aptata]|uniref:NUDIX hydrolase n=1 Tax=Pseudomonas syringae TaxID=317 RepID=UPI0018E5DF79|nr:NUDIX domain-containing protein [Pseudomonas syringae]MBI6817111.1 NUDIX domain-containing protein [Pseudomonas syringae]MBI6821607.1 NUDIX domain-containing protein [Pseudomonas syringae]MCK0544880.1 NUDIX domain-containing protein [Pseudomonas syringae pv. aptata]